MARVGIKQVCIILGVFDDECFKAKKTKCSGLLEAERQEDNFL
jgi:hypothetical protein